MLDILLSIFDLTGLVFENDAADNVTTERKWSETDERQDCEEGEDDLTPVSLTPDKSSDWVSPISERQEKPIRPTYGNNPHCPELYTYLTWIHLLLEQLFSFFFISFLLLSLTLLFNLLSISMNIEDFWSDLLFRIILATERVIRFSTEYDLVGDITSENNIYILTN